jgi:serine/threonine protein kinase
MSGIPVTTVLDVRSGELLVAESLADPEKTRTFQLVRQLSPPILPDGTDKDIGSEVIVWAVQDVDSEREYVVKFYNPKRQTTIAAATQDTTDFFFATERFIDDQLRGINASITEIEATGVIRFDSSSAKGRSDAAAGITDRRFAIITTPFRSNDFSQLLDDLIELENKTGSVPMYVQYLVRVAASQLLTALDAMHEAGVTHQDIKVENMVIGGPASWNVSTAESKFREHVALWNVLTDQNVPLDGFQHGNESRWTRPQYNSLSTAIALAMAGDLGQGMGDMDLQDPGNKRSGEGGDEPDPKRPKPLSAPLMGDDLEQAKLKWARAVAGDMFPMLIDFDRSRSMNDIPDLGNIGIDGTVQTIDPWRFITGGEIAAYEFGPSPLHQQVRAALQGSDLWSMGITLFELANLYNPFLTTADPDPNVQDPAADVLRAFDDSGLPPDVLDEFVQGILAANTSDPDGSLNRLTEETFAPLAELLRVTPDGSTRPSMSMIGNTDYPVDPAWEAVRPLLSFRVSDRYRVPLSEIAAALLE